MSYNKLVRDKIPDIIKENGEKPIIRILDDFEYKLELEKKLLEEYNEVLDSNGDSRLEELADMIEVISHLAGVEGASLDKVVEIANVKKSKRGGFQNKIYLIGVDNSN
ncbi:MAG: nucleoside triphosphate pyrophosphohydrolase [Bacilli bacterium]|nr:nucleoside triphosphate pyrophosphohydrolase [Bacilli bacterium]